MLKYLMLMKNYIEKVYGKLDFLLLNTRPWWPEWKAMINDIMKQGNKIIITDVLTSNLLNGVFNCQIKNDYLYIFDRLHAW